MLRDLQRLQQSVEEALDPSTDAYPDMARLLIQRTFDGYVSRPLVGNAPIRLVLFKGPKESIRRLIEITGEFDTRVVALLSSGTSLTRIRRMLDQSSEANILSRSLMVLNLYFDGRLLGKYSMTDMILDDVQHWTCLPDTIVRDEQVRLFTDRLAKPIYDTLKLRALNAHRQRAFIESVLLEDWKLLQTESQILDVQCRQQYNLDPSTPPFFSQYALTILLNLMERFVSLSIRLGLCYGSNSDMSFAFWYRDFLLSGQLNTLTSMRRWRVEMASMLGVTPAHVNGSKKGKGKRKPGSINHSSAPVPTDEDKETEAELILLSLKRDLCRGTIRFMAAVRQVTGIHDGPFEFTSLPMIFEKRFGLFRGTRQPQPLTYDDYVEGTDFSQVDRVTLRSSASEVFRNSKAVAECLRQDLTNLNPIYAPVLEPELLKIIKVCVGNSVYLMKLDQIDSPSVSADFDFSAHPEFCTIKLSR
jgi:hypothetical protein